MQTQQQHSPSLDELHAAHARVWGELKALAAEVSPWHVGAQYFARAFDASVARGRAMDARLRHLERLEREITGYQVPVTWRCRLCGVSGPASKEDATGMAHYRSPEHIAKRTARAMAEIEAMETEVFGESRAADAGWAA